MSPPKELNSKVFSSKVMIQGQPTWGRKMKKKRHCFLKYHIESITAQKAEILVSDISVRFSCQISRGKGYLKTNAFFFT